MKKLILFTLFLSFCSFFNYSKLKAVEINCNSPVWKKKTDVKENIVLRKWLKN